MLTSGALPASLLVAAAPGAGGLAENNFGDTRAGDGLAGPMALLLILLLAIATVLLVRNMTKRIKRLPSTFDNDSADRS